MIILSVLLAGADKKAEAGTGADKKAEAGAGAATEFQFVSKVFQINSGCHALL